MKLRKGSLAVVNMVDGTVVRGRVIRSWRWHVVRITDSEAVTAQGAIPTAGDVLIPWRSILLTQEVTDG